MRALGGKLLIALLIVAMAPACSRNREPKLLNIASSTEGPDEFAILPNKPLQQPENFAEQKCARLIEQESWHISGQRIGKTS